jgi:hypothetical protein
VGLTLLFKQQFLDGIQAGRVTLAFRKWRRPSVKVNGTLLTSVGQLKIRAIELVQISDLTKADAKKAGFDSLEALLSDLSQQRDGQLYRIRFALAGPDPRVALRRDASLSAADVDTIAAKLRRLDERSSSGAWTARVLKLIARHPEMSAAELAVKSGFEKQWLKLNVRKLKNLGLTESLNPGYRLSPRGKAFLSQQ